ncbi:MAG TPA: GNAT family N-acetyltransferase [Nocardioidaceae bacterium]|nr:GNAT family N-acetyltransferase [Actinomycetota bacterium]HEV8056413.1 GNAT family N-acetyltransferase [Nocardioidaceae bacterium]
MPELVSPTTRVRRSFLAAVAELRAEGNGQYDGTSVYPPVGGSPGEAWELPVLETEEGFRHFTTRLVEISDADSDRPPGYVPATALWWVDGDTYLGRLSIRHRLTDDLLRYGGHIGYVVRPSARRRGHATAMLRAALPVAAALGIDPVLVTCDDDNAASRSVIETAGGRLEDQRGRKLRFWVPVGS